EPLGSLPVLFHPGNCSTKWLSATRVWTRRQWRDHYANMDSTEYQELDSSNPAPHSDLKFVDQLFHDAESTAEGPLPETDPNEVFCEFFRIVCRHHPQSGNDPRSELCLSSEKYWKSILHPDLVILGQIWRKMFVYIRPEWAYRPELNPEHVHEALMRLLLAEIVRIDETKGDIALAIGARRTPPPSAWRYRLPAF
ncbi:hypothetical protein FRC11_000945, partial [Ceratobasidium sp. 423]